MLRSAVALLLVAACGAPEPEEPPVPQAASEPRAKRPGVSADRAGEYLRKQVAFGPRVPGSPGHRAQLEWMIAFLRERADTVETQAFTHRASDGKTLPLTNVIARFNPDASDRLLFLAHWDTRPTADAAPTAQERARPIDGANDGASGVAVLLEIANLLKAQPPTVGVDLLFVDGEDYGPDSGDMYLGAKHFARTLPAGYRPRYGVLLDMVGDATPRFLIEPYSRRHAPQVLERVWSVAAALGYGNVFLPRLYQTGDIMDDHIPLNEAGIPTVNVIDFDYGPNNSFWHTHQDVVENTSAETLGIVGEVVAELIYRGG